VEPDYLPDSEVFVFNPCLYPMKTIHPSTRGGCRGGFHPPAGSRGR
jgi:hypothetical protein